MEQSKELKSPLYVVYVEFEKAFNSLESTNSRLRPIPKFRWTEKIEENKSTPNINIRRWRWIDHMKETENFHHPAGTPLEPTGEQTK